MATNIRTLRCVYCGDLATCRDHVIPACVLGYRRRHFRRGDWIVSACHECNQILGSELLVTVPTRAEYLFARYQKRWKKILRSPVWTIAERAELAGNLSRHIEALENLRDICIRRLDHLSLVSQMDEDYLRP